MALIVKKYGGSSVGTTEKILNVAQRVIDKYPYRFTREMDMLLTTGEQVSIALLTTAFSKLGHLGTVRK